MTLFTWSCLLHDHLDHLCVSIGPAGLTVCIWTKLVLPSTDDELISSEIEGAIFHQLEVITLMLR